MKTFITLTMAAAAIAATAQKRLTLEEVVPGNRAAYAHYNTGIRGLFNQQTDKFLCTQTDDAYLDKANQTIRQLLGQARIIAIKSDNEVWVRTQTNDYLVNLSSATITDSLLDTSLGSSDINAQHTAVANELDGNLYVSTSTAKYRVNAQEATDGILYGTSVHRNEFGIVGGTFWSNNGQKLAFYRMDETMVEKYPIVNIDEREAKTNEIRYPMAGMTSHEVTVGIFDVNTQNVIYLKTESPVNRYFTNIAWSADDKNILIAEINRDQNHMWLNMYDTTTGDKIKTIFEEQSNEWVEPTTPALFIDNHNFLWLSERSGYKHLYLYNTDGTYKQLTNGNWCITSLYGYNPKSKEVIFQANREGYMNKDIYKVNLKGKTTRLTTGDGIHTGALSPHALTLVDNHTSANVAMTSSIINVKDGKSTQISQVTTRYEGYTLPQIDTISLKTADGQFDIKGRIILPTDFDASKKYPTIVYLYGGPHAHLVDGGYQFGTSSWMLYFAQQGYIIFSIDNRGSEDRGAAFEHAIHRNLGKHEMEDQMVGINYLKTLPYVDTDRIGIHGWSFGGFMTINMMETYNDTFRCGVAGGPVCDWSLYEIMYGERYMDTPEQNPEGYANANVSQNTSKLKGRLLVIHGDIDPVVVWQNSLRLLQNAVDNDILIDYAVYPRHEHNVIGPDRVHLFKKILQYFDDHLKR